MNFFCSNDKRKDGRKEREKKKNYKSEFFFWNKTFFLIIFLIFFFWESFRFKRKREKKPSGEKGNKKIGMNRKVVLFLNSQYLSFPSNSLPTLLHLFILTIQHILLIFTLFLTVKIILNHKFSSKNHIFFVLLCFFWSFYFFFFNYLFFVLCFSRLLSQNLIFMTLELCNLVKELI